MSSGQGRV